MLIREIKVPRCNVLVLRLRWNWINCSEQDLSFNPTGLTGPSTKAHVYTLRNTAEHYNFPLTEQKGNKLYRKLHGDVKTNSRVQCPENQKLHVKVITYPNLNS